MRNARLPLCLLVTGLGSGLPSAAGQELADRVLTGGKVATLDGEGFAQALALRGGHVLATGSDEQIRRHVGESTTVHELGGRTVIPGLNDSHLHVVRAGRFYNLELRWDGVRSLRQALAMVAEQAARTPKGQWVRVIGAWSPYQFEERRMPTVQELNEAAPDTPVFVLFLYSKAWMNRAGVEALGIDENTVPPKGGRYHFVDGGAELIAEPNPTILYKTIGALPQLTTEQQLNSSRHFLADLSRLGVTSAIDAGGGGHVFPTDYRAAEQLARQGELPVRISYFLFPQRPGKELEDFQGWTSRNQAGVNAHAVRRHGYVLQGGGEFLVWAAGDFENFLAPRPELQRMMDRQLAAVATLLVQKRWPFRIHATYGESIDRLLDVFEQVHREHPFDGLRWAIDHGETLRLDQIPRIRALGGGVAIQDRMAFAGEFFLERYGPERTAQAPPLRSLLESGIPLGAGTDATRVSSHNPWMSLEWMVSGRSVGGTELIPEEGRLSRLEALRLFTAGSAWFSAEEHEKGVLAPGMLADLAVLSDDYFTVAEGEIRGLHSVLTLVGGEVVHATGPYAEFTPARPPVDPAWSPAAHFPPDHW